MKAPRVMLIAIGDELITERPDTNTQIAAAGFQAAGWQVLGRLQVPDETSAIQKALRQARIGSELALCCAYRVPYFYWTREGKKSIVTAWRYAAKNLQKRYLRGSMP
jgi:hypothetical protein